MSKRADDAIYRIREVISQATCSLPPVDYMQVLEEIGADVDGSIDALKEENPEEFDG